MIPQKRKNIETPIQAGAAKAIFPKLALGLALVKEAILNRLRLASKAFSETFDQEKKIQSETFLEKVFGSENRKVVGLLIHQKDSKLIHLFEGQNILYQDAVTRKFTREGQADEAFRFEVTQGRLRLDRPDQDETETLVSNEVIEVSDNSYVLKVFPESQQIEVDFLTVQNPMEVSS